MKKRKKWDALLDDFVTFTQQDLIDPVFRAEWLYKRINKSGLFTISTKGIVTEEHAKHLRCILHATFAVMLDPASFEQIYGSPFTVKVGWDKDNPDHLADLSGAGEDGVWFVLRFLLEVEGITKVKICNHCGRFFFPKKADREVCYEPRDCKKEYKKIQRKKREQEVKK